MNAQTEIKPNPENIFEAIAQATSEVKMLGKSERNKFDGYDFVSIDKFLTLVNPICSNNGLFPIVAQREVEFYENTNSKGSKSTWARFFFDITLYHRSGETLGPINSMVCVPMNGAQTTGSAQSYALKQFFRGTLMIPTGDKDDPDFLKTEDHVAQSVTPDQFIKLRDLSEQAGVDAETICKAFSAPSLQQFPADKFDSAMKKLNATIEAAPKDGDLNDELPEFKSKPPSEEKR